MSEIPAISLWQPYASLIAIGAKRFETRHWPAPKRLVGKQVAIHAAKRKPTRDEIEALDHLVPDAFGFCNWPARVPYGAVVCFARLRRCSKVVGRNDATVEFVGEEILDDGLGDYSVGRYCWELTSVRRLDDPVPARGAQGWWTWTLPTEMRP